MDSNRKYLFICNTPFQIIVAVLINKQLIKKNTISYSDIMVSDQINDYQQMIINLRETGIFETVILTRNKKIFQKRNRIIFLASRFICELFGNIIYKRHSKNRFYDEIFINNPSCFAESIVYLIRKSNKSLKVNLFDEGYSSYTKLYENSLYTFNFVENIIRLVWRKIFKRKYIIDLINLFYLLEPDLLCWNTNFEVMEIESLNIKTDNLTIDNLNQIFGYSDAIKEYDFQYIYFEESFFWDYKINSDYNLIMKIVEQVGYKNIIVKLHPRNKINRFEKSNINTNKNLGIPWEIMTLNFNEKSKIYITITSGAALSFRLITNQMQKTILLYDCIDDKLLKPNDDVILWFEKYISKFSSQIYLPKSNTELIEILKTFSQ